MHKVSFRKMILQPIPPGTPNASLNTKKIRSNKKSNAKAKKVKTVKRKTSGIIKKSVARKGKAKKTGNKKKLNLQWRSL